MRFMEFPETLMYYVLLVTFDKGSNFSSKAEGSRSPPDLGVAVQSCHRRGKPHVETLLVHSRQLAYASSTTTNFSEATAKRFP